MVTTDLSDQVHSIPVIPSALTQVHNTVQEVVGSRWIFLCRLSFWFIEEKKGGEISSDLVSKCVCTLC